MDTLNEYLIRDLCNIVLDFVGNETEELIKCNLCKSEDIDNTYNFVDYCKLIVTNKKVCSKCTEIDENLCCGCNVVIKK